MRAVLPGQLGHLFARRAAHNDKIELYRRTLVRRAARSSCLRVPLQDSSVAASVQDAPDRAIRFSNAIRILPSRVESRLEEGASEMHSNALLRSPAEVLWLFRS